MIQRLGDVEKVFELSEKSRKKSISRADLLHDTDLNSERKFMLEEDSAVSEYEESDTDTDSDTNSKSGLDSAKKVNNFSKKICVQFLMHFS